MSPNNGVSGVRTALAMGAAKAVLVSDPALAGSDALSTAKVLAKAVERAGGIDLVLAATESTDGYTGTVPAQMAQLLDWPSLTFAKHVEVGEGKLTIQPDSVRSWILRKSARRRSANSSLALWEACRRIKSWRVASQR